MDFHLDFQVVFQVDFRHVFRVEVLAPVAPYDSPLVRGAILAQGPRPKTQGHGAGLAKTNQKECILHLQPLIFFLHHLPALIMAPPQKNEENRMVLEKNPVRNPSEKQNHSFLLVLDLGLFEALVLVLGWKFRFFSPAAPS